MDLNFLDAPLRRSYPAPSRPVNVYEILRKAWRETRVDMTLEFFLDPTERHGLGSLVIDALLATLDGAPLITNDGPSGVSLRAEDFVGSIGWEIKTQSHYIDWSHDGFRD